MVWCSACVKNVEGTSDAGRLWVLFLINLTCNSFDALLFWLVIVIGFGRWCSGCGKVLEDHIFSEEPTFVKNAAGQVLFIGSSSSISFGLMLFSIITVICVWSCCRANWLEDMCAPGKAKSLLLVKGSSKTVWFLLLTHYVISLGEICSFSWNRYVKFYSRCQFCIPSFVN